MKRLEDLSALKQEQVLTLQAKRGSCIVSNVLSTPIFEFTVSENEGTTFLGIDDSKQVHILPLHEAKKLEGYLSATLMSPASSDMESEAKLEFVSTFDMNFKEREIWEEENCACVTESDSCGIFEFQKSHYYSTDENGNKVPGSETPTLSVAVCDDMGEDEIYLTISSKSEIRKLRDYLNNYLENNF